IGSAMSKKPPASVQRVLDIFTPAEGQGVFSKLAEIPRKVYQNQVSRFSPLKTMEDKVFKEAGGSRIGIDLARKFEQVAGAPAKAEADII
ncbi:hypothetical protein H6A11_08765, partial [Bifidobacterium pullorum subsp. saeculare]|uniref:hypothetical protein n=1 Tax=Bifidobacterium pullorum TaxID=78448 RepID=UPI00195EEE72